MTSKVIKSTLLFSGFVFIAQIIGLVRDLYLVRFFGLGSILDTYYLAFKIPDLMNVFYSVFLGSVIFIPLLTKTLHENGESGLQREVNKVGSLVFALVATVAVILFLIMPYLAQLLAPTWQQDQLDLLIFISRVLLLAQLFFPIGILAGAIGMVQDKPFGMAISGAVYNIFILLGAFFLTPYFGIYGVVYGVILGAVFFALVQIFPKKVRGHFAAFSFQIEFLEWWQFVKQNLGRFFTVLLNQTFYIVILSFAAASGTGGVTIFNNAFNIYMAIFFIMGASFSTALIPHNSKLHVEGKHEELKNSLHTSIIYMFSVSVFFALFCVIFSRNIIEILYYFSNLSQIEISQMANVFIVLAMCLPLLNLSEILRKYMYASDLIKYSVVNVASFLLFLVLFNNFFLYLNIANLLALSWAFFFGNISALVLTLLLLSYLGRLSLIFVLKNIYKSLLVFIFTFFAYLFTYLYIYKFITDISFHYFFILILSGVYLFIIYIFFMFLFNDQISKSLWKKIVSYVV